MSLTIKEVEGLAELAKIELTAEEKNKLLGDMEAILDYVKVIEEVKVPESSVSYPHKNIWREDTPREEKDFSLDSIVEQFPDSQNGFVKVKKIL